jgi:hypothetical protein
MQHFLIIALGLAFFACEASPPPAAPSTPPPATPVAPIAQIQTLEISKHGTLLGHRSIEPGRAGALALVVDTEDARELRSRWQRVQSGEKQIAIEMHLPTKDGSRGPLGMRFYKPTETNYVDGVRLWLTWEQGYDDGYEVK